MILWTTACQTSLSITSSQSPTKSMFVELLMPPNHLILCRPLLLLPSIFPNTSVFFQWVSSSYKMAKVLEFQLQHQSFQWTHLVFSMILMLKILQARFQQCVNHENPDIQAGFRKGRGMKDQIANIHWIIEKAWEFQTNSALFLLYLTMPKLWLCGPQ